MAFEGNRPTILNSAMKPRFGTFAWILLILGLLIMATWVISVPYYVETGPQKVGVTWWLGRGEVGRLNKFELPPSELRRPPDQIHAMAEGKTFSFALPVELYDFRLLGFQLAADQVLSRDGQRLYQRESIHIPLWMIGGVFLIQPMIKVATVRLARRRHAVQIAHPFKAGNA